MICPKCKKDNSFRTENIAILAIGKPRKDTNRVTCKNCDHVGLAWKFGRPDIPPMNGTEEWSDQTIKQWWKDLKSGKVQFFGNPVNRSIEMIELGKPQSWKKDLPPKKETAMQICRRLIFKEAIEGIKNWKQRKIDA